ncbi:MAG: hypothetical protein ABIJ65_11365, partial [Chloroflexota bacterium]
MDIYSAHAFLPGEQPSKPGPLGRFLPVLPIGVINTHLLQSGIQPGAFILDPFGASSHLVMEMARSGYRVLSAVNNPITR